MKKVIALLMSLLLIFAMTTACTKETASEVVPIIQPLIEAAIVALGALIYKIIRTSVVPWLKEKRLYSKVKWGVQCAEQLQKNGMLQNMFGVADGPAKKKYVVAFLQRLGIEVTDEVDAMIESAVYELNKAAKKALTGLLADDTDTE